MTIFNTRRHATSGGPGRPHDPCTVTTNPGVTSVGPQLPGG